MKETPEQSGLDSWTELCESCEWDELEALRTLERFIHAKPPQPTGRIRELCTALTHAYMQIKQSMQDHFIPEA